MKKLFFWYGCFCLLFLMFSCQPSTVFKENVDDVNVVFDDIDNFWVMYDSLPQKKTEEEKIATIERLYFDKGTEALRQLNEKDETTAEAYLKLIQKYPKYIASIRAASLGFKDKHATIMSSLRTLKELYPDARFSDIYFLMGVWRHGGTVVPEGAVIGTEMQCSNDDIDLSELGDRSVVKYFQSPEKIVSMIVHESVHPLQNGTGRTFNLLKACIKEGAADFIAYLVTGEQATVNSTFAYGEANEQQLWKEFKREMYGKNKGKWLNNPSYELRPPDLGYFMGFKICQHYYNNASDKRQAVKDIIEIKDFEAFLFTSGYNKKFE